MRTCEEIQDEILKLKNAIYEHMKILNDPKNKEYSKDKA
jgi:hypothetical protein